MVFFFDIIWLKNNKLERLKFKLLNYFYTKLFFFPVKAEIVVFVN